MLVSLPFLRAFYLWKWLHCNLISQLRIERQMETKYVLFGRYSRHQYWQHSSQPNDQCWYKLDTQFRPPKHQDCQNQRSVFNVYKSAVSSNTPLLTNWSYFLKIKSPNLNLLYKAYVFFWLRISLIAWLQKLPEGLGFKTTTHRAPTRCRYLLLKYLT